MTQTIQLGLSNPGKYLAIGKGEEKDNINIQFAASPNMNKLYETISKLNNILKKTNIEKIKIYNNMNKLNEALSRLNNAANHYTVKR
jgi:uncharacterized protein YukE